MPELLRNVALNGLNMPVIRHLITLFLVVCGALVSYFTMVNDMNKEISTVRSDNRVQSLQLSRLSGVRGEIDVIQIRLDALQDWMKAVSQRTDEIPSRLAAIEAGIEEIKQRFDRVDNRLNRMQNRSERYRDWPPHEAR